MNTELYQEFEKVAMSLIGRGFKRYSPDGIGHIVRYHTAIREGTDFKINNNSIALLAREFIRNHPEHQGFFQLRRSKHDLDRTEFKVEGNQYVMFGEAV